MNKQVILSILVICLAVAAAGNGKRRKQKGANRKTATATRFVDPNTVGRARNKAARVEPPTFSTTTPYVSTTAFVPTTPSVKTRQQLGRRTNSVLSAQRALGGQRAAGGAAGAVSQSSLQAGERDLDALQALLQQKQARQERIDAKAERKARRKDAARAASGDKLKAANSVDYETYDQAEEFNNLEAVVGTDIQNKFALQVVSENDFKENAAISESGGSKRASGTKFSVQEAVDAESFIQEEVLQESESVDNQLLDAETASEDLLNAQEASRVESQATIDAQDFQQVGGNFRGSQGVFGGSAFGNSGNPFGNNDIFGNNAFGSLFKRR